MIYFLQFIGNGFIKIGTTVDVDVRQPALERQYGRFKVLGYLPGGVEREAELHQQFVHSKAGFKREFFLPTKELCDFIAKNTTMEYEKPAPLVNVQVDDDVREMLGILKKRYNVGKMGDALREFLREKDAELVTAGQMLVRVQSRAIGSDDVGRDE